MYDLNYALDSLDSAFNKLDDTFAMETTNFTYQKCINEIKQDFSSEYSSSKIFFGWTSLVY